MKATMGMNYRLLSTNLESMSNRLFELRQQAATGKKLNRPSDDPSAIRPVLNYRMQSASTERYLKHLGSAAGEMKMLDGQLGNVENIMVSAKETTSAAMNGQACHIASGSANGSMWYHIDPANSVETTVASNRRMFVQGMPSIPMVVGSATRTYSPCRCASSTS